MGSCYNRLQTITCTGGYRGLVVLWGLVVPWDEGWWVYKNILKICIYAEK